MNELRIAERKTPTFEKLETVLRFPRIAAGTGGSQSQNDCQMDDEQILDQVRRTLDGSGYEQLRRVHAYCSHGRVILQGRISTYYMKQLAQELIRNVENIRDIDNDLRVVCGR
jgi:osmotically-inducible protein OsmY